MTGPWRRSSWRRSAWRRCASRRSACRRSFSSQVIAVSVGSAVRATWSNNTRRSMGNSVQSGGIGASRQRSVPLSKVSQPRRYSSVRPMVLAGIVSQTIHRVPASSSNSRSAMHDANCTGQATTAKPVRTAKLALCRCLGDGGLWAAGDRTLADVPVVALTAPDAMPPAAQLNDLGNLPPRGCHGTARPHGLVGRPRAPAMEQPTARGRLDRLPGLVRGWPARRTACLSIVPARFGGVYAAGPLVWTLNIDGWDRKRSRATGRVRRQGIEARSGMATVGT